MRPAPYRPGVADKVAFWFGPLINLRRFGYPVKASKVLLWTLVVAAGLAVVLLLTPDLPGRVIAFAAEFTFYKVYASIQEKEFADWQTANPSVEPQNGWKALGWGFAGLALFVLIIIGVAIPLSMVLPSE
jgi:hypothetical protein